MPHPSHYPVPTTKEWGRHCHHQCKTLISLSLSMCVCVSHPSNRWLLLVFFSCFFLNFIFHLFFSRYKNRKNIIDHGARCRCHRAFVAKMHKITNMDHRCVGVELLWWRPILWLSIRKLSLIMDHLFGCMQCYFTIQSRHIRGKEISNKLSSSQKNSCRTWQPR